VNPREKLSWVVLTVVLGELKLEKYVAVALKGASSDVIILKV